MAKIKWYLVAAGMLVGMILMGWGWDKNESTIAERTHGAIAMIVVGAIMFVVSLITLALGSSKRNT